MCSGGGEEEDGRLYKTRGRGRSDWEWEEEEYMKGETEARS